MRLSAAFGVLFLAGLAQTAPAPFIESAVPEAVLETGSLQRALSLERWIKAADLAQQLTPGKSALPADFLSRLKVHFQTESGRAVLRLRGSASPADRALFKALVARVSRTGTPGPDAVIRTQLEEQILLQRKVALLGGGMRGRAWRGGFDELDMMIYQQEVEDAEIRANPPKLVGKSR
jgi:hypothetical protein